MLKVKWEMWNVVLSTLACALMLCGCKTQTVVEDFVEIVYDSGLNRFEFLDGNHPDFAPDEIADALKKARIPKDREVRVNMQQFNNPRIITETKARLGTAGYMRVVFCTLKTAQSQGNLTRRNPGNPPRPAPRAPGGASKP